MKKSNLTRSLMAGCSIVVLSAVMYGCSSSGEDTARMSADEYKAKYEEAVKDLTGANAKVDILTALIGSETEPAADSLRGMLAAAEADVTRLEGELTTATDNASNLQTMLETAKADVTRLEGELTTAKDELAEIKKDAADVLTEAARKERIARATKIQSAIDDSSDDTTNRKGNGLDSKSGVDDVTAKRGADGMVTVDLNKDAKDVYAGGSASADAGGWTGTTLTRTNVDKSEDTIVVYTDIEAPTPTTLGDELTAGSIKIGTDAERGRIVPTAKPAAGATLTYMKSTDGKLAAFTGTYRGISGTFECNTSCTVSLNDDGEAMVGDKDTFSFVPDSIASTYDAADEAYAYFGWWLNKPEKADGTHTVEVFSGGVGSADNVAKLDKMIKGDATYAGSAAGQYVTKSFTAGAQTDASVGGFAADANLKATFGNGVKPDDATIAGTVTNFVLDNGSNPSWEVTLEKISDIEDKALKFEKGKTEVDFGGGTTASKNGAGSWQGSFYDAGKGDAAAPGTVAGTFSASTSGASLLGAFGATKQ